MGRRYHYQAHSSIENLMVGGSKSRTRKYPVCCSSSTSLWHNLPLPYLITSESAPLNISHKTLWTFFSFAGGLLLLLSKGYFTPPYFAVHLEVIPHKPTPLLWYLWKRIQATKELQFVKTMFLCNIYGKKFSPFPLAIALKKGVTSLPETSSGCVVIPSLTAWYPFSMITGAHPNHKVNMLPWIFASYRWEGSQESTNKIPHTANKQRMNLFLHWL